MQPRHIPTIEEQREKVFNTRRSNNARSGVPLPDLSRPPPGFARPPVQTLPIPFYQPQPVYSYEDTIVTRVLQSLMGSRGHKQVEPPHGQPQDVVNKVMNWDTGAGLGGKEISDECRRSLGELERSLSRGRRRSKSREKAVHKGRRR